MRLWLNLAVVLLEVGPLTRRHLFAAIAAAFLGRKVPRERVFRSILGRGLITYGLLREQNGYTAAEYSAAFDRALLEFSRTCRPMPKIGDTIIVKRPVGFKV